MDTPPHAFHIRIHIFLIRFIINPPLTSICWSTSRGRGLTCWRIEFTSVSSHVIHHHHYHHHQHHHISSWFHLSRDSDSWTWEALLDSFWLSWVWMSPVVWTLVGKGPNPQLCSCFNQGCYPTETWVNVRRKSFINKKTKNKNILLIINSINGGESSPF